MIFKIIICIKSVHSCVTDFFFGGGGGKEEEEAVYKAINKS